MISNACAVCGKPSTAIMGRCQSCTMAAVNSERAQEMASHRTAWIRDAALKIYVSGRTVHIPLALDYAAALYDEAAKR